MLLERLVGGDNDAGGAVVQRGGVARRGDVTQGGHRAQLGQDLHRGARAGAFVGIDDGDVALAVGDLDGHDLPGELAGLNRGERALLGTHSEGVRILAANTKDVGHLLGGLRHGVGHLLLLRELWVGKTPANGGIKNLAWLGKRLAWLLHDPGRAGHGFDATGDDNIRLAGFHEGGGQGNRGHARSTQTVDRHPGNGVREPGEQPGHAGDVAVLLAGAVGVADDDFIHRGGIESGLLHRLLDGGGHEVIWANRGQCAAVAAHGGAEAGYQVCSHMIP